VKSGEPLKTMGEARTVLVLRRAHGLTLGDHVLQEEHEPSFTRGSPAPRAAVEPTLVVLTLDLFCCFFQSTPNGGLVRK